MGAQKCVLAVLTLETELWGVEFDRHGAGVRCWGWRQAELVIGNRGCGWWESAVTS